MAPAHGQFIKIKSALSDTPEIQEIKRAIRVLREDSARKLSMDVEVHEAIGKLSSQVHGVRNSLSSLSDAFMQEATCQGTRICELEDKIRAICDRQTCTAQAVEKQLVHAREQMEGALASSNREAQAHVNRVGSAHKDALQRFQEDIYTEIGSLSNATTDKIAELASETQTILGNVRKDAEDGTGELASQYKALKDSQRHGNAMLVKQLSSIVRDIAQLTDSYESLQTKTKEDSTQIKQLHKEHQQQQDQLSETVQQLQQDLRHTVKEGHASSRMSEDEFRTALSEVKQQLNTQQQLVDARTQQLQDSLQKHEDTARTAQVATADEHSRLQKLVDECTGGARQEAAEVQNTLQEELREAVSKASTGLEKVRAETSQRLRTVEEALEENKRLRGNDLEIIERALVVAHTNHEKSDRVLHNTIGTLKELEGRCNVTAQQGDIMADRIEEIQHRVGIIQQTMLPPALGAADASDDHDHDVLG